MFKDSYGREFQSVIVLPTVIELKKLGIDPGEDLPKVLEKLEADPELLGNVLYLVHEDAAKAMQVSPGDFGRLLNGDVLPGAVDSFVDAIVNFSPPAIRGSLRKLVQKGKEVEVLAKEQLDKALDKLTPQAILDHSTSSGPVGNTPGLSELISSTRPGKKRPSL